MGLYKEIKTKLNFNVLNENDIELTVTSFPGVRVATTANSNGVQVWNNETLSIGNSNLKGTLVRLISITEDRTEGGIQVTLSIKQKEGENLSYIFPDDFTGSPDFDENDQMPTFYTYINFK
jgi:hypothetical protein